MRQQVILKKESGIAVVYNASENSIVTDFKPALIVWAKEKGYDGIVIGRIQESFDRNYQFATHDGKNEVPIKYVVNKLNDVGCKNVVSFMNNKSSFWLPHPFTDQIDGELHMYESTGFKVSGFDITDSKLKIRSDNFSAVVVDGAVDGDFSKPWDMN